MAEAVLASSTSTRLEPFLLLSKSAKGAACIQLIQDVLAAPGVYVFSELLEMPNVQELRQDAKCEPYLRLLELFAYGTYRDFIAQASTLPSLSAIQLRKLRHLSMVTLSSDCRSLAYDMLLDYLQIPNVRELEDLIIDAIYQELIKGKLDQKKKCLEVEYAMGRDVRPEQVDSLISTLGTWAKTSENVLAAIDEQITKIAEASKAQARETQDYEALVAGQKMGLRHKGVNSFSSKWLH
ncbi:COP9 signalosome complex subunit 7a [Gaertneriomyces sp. JEL0708]|nr:COP9 signalosome complex subunit 7a [Gaertneriomyces sp. JEL0708]